MSLVLKHDGESVDLEAAHCELGALVQSFLSPWTLTLRRAIAFDEPTDWQNEDAIQLVRDGTVVFEGRITSSERVASTGGEHIAYTCVGLRDSADGIPFQHTIGGSLTARVVYNCPADEVGDEAGYVALAGTTSTVGQILADVLDTMATELAGIIGTGAAASGYIASELDAMTAVPGKLAFNGVSVDEAVRTLLQHSPDFGWYVDAATHRARFIDLRSLATRNVAGVGDAVLQHALDFSTAGCYSACTVQGAPELVDVFETLTPAWDTGLESTWETSKAIAFPDTYGMVWRLFSTTTPAADNGVIQPQRLGGLGEIPVSIEIWQAAKYYSFFTNATPVTDTTLLLDTYARQWNSYEEEYEPATVQARFTYRKGRVTGRYPASGYTGTAYSRRGLQRELFLVQEERGKKTLTGAISSVVLQTKFRTVMPIADTDALVGATIDFNGNNDPRTITANEMTTITFDSAPDIPIVWDDDYIITLQDDTVLAYESDTLSLLQKYAKERLERVMDERVVGRAPLAGLDWTLALGQKINFTGTNDPEYASLGAALTSVEHDLATERTLLELTTDRSSASSWGELDQQLQQGRAVEENMIMIRRLWKRLRRRRSSTTTCGDMFLKDDVGPFVGDDTWITIGTDKVVRHSGPETEGDVTGGTGKYIEWIEIDDRGHVVDVGAGTFS